MQNLLSGLWVVAMDLTLTRDDAWHEATIILSRVDRVPGRLKYSPASATESGNHKWSCTSGHQNCSSGADDNQAMWLRILQKVIVCTCSIRVEQKRPQKVLITVHVFVAHCRYGSVDLLVKDEVRGEVEHLCIGVFVGAPAEAKGGQTHPWVLDQGDLVLNGQTPET